MLLKVVKKNKKTHVNEARQYEKALVIAERLVYYFDKIECEIAHGEKQLEAFYESNIYITYSDDVDKKICQKKFMELVKYLDSVRETCQTDMENLMDFSIEYEQQRDANALLEEYLPKL